MSEDTFPPITAHFAIVKSVTSRWATPDITKVEPYTDGINKEDKSMSQCGKFYVYGTDYVFMSQCFPLTIPFRYSLEDEIDTCNRAINGIRNESYKRMEMAIEVPKARLTELLQLQHLQPEPDEQRDSQQDSEDALFEDHPLFNPEA